MTTIPKDNSSENIEKTKRGKELVLIVVLISLIVLVTYVETKVSVISGDLPITTKILILGLININIIFLLLLVILIFRNAFKIFYEGRQSVIVGSKLRTKIVLSFFGLAFIPTFFLFCSVVYLINSSVDIFFDVRIEESLKESLDLGKSYYNENSKKVLNAAQNFSRVINEEGLLNKEDELKSYLELTISAGDFATLEVFRGDAVRVAYAMNSKITPQMVPDISISHVVRSIQGEAMTFNETENINDIIRAVTPIFEDNIEGAEVTGVVALSYHVPFSMLIKMEGIESAYARYSQLKFAKPNIKLYYYLILSSLMLLIVFSAIWIGRRIANNIITPIHELAEGTHAIASGNLDYKIDIRSSDEIGSLVKSFNRMTEDLKAGKVNVEEANLNLRAINDEIEQYSRYIEIVLGNIPSGVISIDKSGIIVSLNRVAAEMLGTREASAKTRNYKEILKPEDRDFLKDLIKDMDSLGVENIERQHEVTVKGNVITLLVNLNALKDDRGEYLGMVAVLDDMSHLLKTQRMFAWKEVARRIAHEIKNPLTPIQLSAQRLRKKYLHEFSGEEEILDECTKTIIKQVDDLKNLVNEFSNFARMPAANPSANDLNAIIEETVSLYDGGRKKIKVTVDLDKNMPVLYIDRDQVKRVMINLIDNALASIEGDAGSVRVITSFDKSANVAHIEIADTGCGVSLEDKERLFEPYFSTKKSGTGLGLAIVSNIIADHNGYIRVKDNEPHGTRFLIELPVKAVSI